MSKPPNQLKTVQLRLSTTTAVLEYLKCLVSSGLYGPNHCEAAERLLTRGIEQLIQEGVIERHGDQEPRKPT
jgi:hypothetical protein